MQYSWVTKALVQKIISFLPFRHSINFFFQKHVTHGVELTDEYFSDRLIHARNHLKYFTELTGSEIPSKTLELGTGWYPVIPIYFFLKGVNRIYTVDIADHIKRDYTKLTIKRFLSEIEAGRLSVENEQLVQERIEQLKSILKSESIPEQQLLYNLGIIVKIRDARDSAFGVEVFDLIHSNNTFEHISETELKEILGEFNKLLKKGGIMSHFIDMTDHFAHFDKSISIYNFLRFSPSKWRMIDNSIQPQNRLRVTDFENIYKELGVDYKIVEIREGNVDELSQIPLHKTFSNYTKDNLAMSHCQFVTLKK